MPAMDRVRLLLDSLQRSGGSEMTNRETSGDNRQRRKAAREARARGEQPGEAGATTGATQQRERVEKNADHETRVGQKNKGKLDSISRHADEARPRSRNRDR
jgi:hypothetical protein